MKSVLFLFYALLSPALAGDPVSALNDKLRAGAVQLNFDDAHGYLRSVLDALHVPLESQLLVFSKTSGQAMKIEPRNPRALYFNDSVAVGWVHGGLLEAMAQSPHGDIAFYTLDQRPWVYRERTAEALFEPRPDCLHCHGSGTLVLSVSPSPDGVPVNRLGLRNTDHRTPFADLWGGWYVTGTSAAPHMGNGIVTHARLESMKPAFDPAAYPTPYSDIVALMVFEHQMHMMNLLTAARLRDNVNELVDYMLFIDEPPLPGQVHGASGFAAGFAVPGLRDTQGRSLRQLDLASRLMRYPCSYMIYAEAFDGLPASTKAAIYKRLWRILSAQEDSAKYARLTLADRRAIVEILRDTKKNLPDYFRPI
jgi:hypothetical protein